MKEKDKDEEIRKTERTAQPAETGPDKKYQLKISPLEVNDNYIRHSSRFLYIVTPSVNFVYRHYKLPAAAYKRHHILGVQW